MLNSSRGYREAETFDFNDNGVGDVEDGVLFFKKSEEEERK